ncbi:Ger(x)C family spore germination protein [Paenibacillus sp. MWE-103]|uniref:Ger(X)C family spore germination protein n=1 Tax=Paenibacillus artemisiicola TaxID=1172618 RepID=A0ABS3W3U9_9BACL|nr:Ger(x)C family spore germination protein [Paenibacillus artemisiicola]MBO7742979.1 Ger(x)C family spore germination protein [Paenibacillus artemisiicola]
MKPVAPRLLPAVAVPLLFLGLLTGCWDTRDINHRALPVCMGIAKQAGLYHVYLQFPDPVKDGLQLKVVSDYGHTITEAVDAISAKMTSDVDLPEVKVIIMERSYAEAGMKESIDNFMRNDHISAKALLVISDEPLESLFAFMVNSFKPTATAIYDSIEKNAGWNPQMALTRVWEVYRSIHSYTRDVAIPIFKSGESGTFDYDGSAILCSGKMVGRIDPDETLLANMFNEESAQGRIEVMNSASVLILQDTVRMKGTFVNGQPGVILDMTIRVSVLEKKGDSSAALIGKELERQTAERVQRMFAKLRKSKSDILGIGQEFRNLIPRDRLKHWRTDYLPRLQVDVRVHPIIQNEGNLTSS